MSDERKLLILDRRRVDRLEYVGDKGQIRFSQEQAKPGGAWPFSSAFLTPHRRAKIGEIYHADVKAYLDGP